MFRREFETFGEEHGVQIVTTSAATGANVEAVGKQCDRRYRTVLTVMFVA